ncbi:hypothetical protein KRM28CT15_25530 [Krasilnikovia sp. M28-CT-15]
MLSCPVVRKHLAGAELHPSFHERPQQSTADALPPPALGDFQIVGVQHAGHVTICQVAALVLGNCRWGGADVRHPTDGAARLAVAGPRLPGSLWFRSCRGRD